MIMHRIDAKGYAEGLLAEVVVDPAARREVRSDCGECLKQARLLIFREENAVAGEDQGVKVRAIVSSGAVRRGQQEDCPKEQKDGRLTWIFHSLNNGWMLSFREGHVYATLLLLSYL